MKQRGRKVITVIAVVLLVAGLGFLLFPPVSNMIGNLIAQGEINGFEQLVANVVDETDDSGNPQTFENALAEGKLDSEGYPVDEDGDRTGESQKLFKADLDRLRKDSIEYNENLKQNQASLLTDSYAYVQPSLDLPSYGIFSGIYGYVSAPSINMELPIYLGASNANMSYGAAHLTYTSLPVGGEKTNTVLAGHTGYVGRIFFDNIRHLEIGAEVEVTNYWETLSYTVVETAIHKPDESQAIYINDDRDLLTMLTCISDGNGGFDRYYVICERSD